ncbi:hypothetical protein PHLH7_06900 [Pseudomonas sp. Ost2]|nr:hypothetical protein PHLH7_06900 [Pseudomonas sp. Ost2]
MRSVSLIKKQPIVHKLDQTGNRDTLALVIHRLLHSICVQAQNLGISAGQLFPKRDKPG